MTIKARYAKNTQKNSKFFKKNNKIKELDNSKQEFVHNNYANLSIGVLPISQVARNKLVSKANKKDAPQQPNHLQSWF